MEVMCHHWGKLPCVVHRDGEFYYDKAEAYKLRTGSTNRQVRFYLYRLFVRRTYGVLGRGHRVRLPRCYEQYVKIMYPNTDGSDFVGYRDLFSFCVVA